MANQVDRSQGIRVWSHVGCYSIGMRWVLAILLVLFLPTAGLGASCCAPPTDACCDSGGDCPTPPSGGCLLGIGAPMHPVGSTFVADGAPRHQSDRVSPVFRTLHTLVLAGPASTRAPQLVLPLRI